MDDTPIAVIGLDARFPGDGDTAETFYDFLLAGRSASTVIPPDRYNVDAFWHPDGDRNGATRARAAHFLKGSISAFDAPFFSITPTEAASMDPQQRGLLEGVYRALENAGIPLEKAAGSQTGVFVGCMYSDYDRMTVKDLDVPAKYAALGNVYSMLSNRVSWFFDFRGPSISVDTACSSSLVALHQACNSLKLREASMTIVGGCNLILSPEFALMLDGAGVLGPDGRSYSFDHRGNGYARGEGIGVVVLKRLSDALRDGDTIRAVIRNTGSNQDGRSPVITQPSRSAQTSLIRQVYSNAGLDPAVTRFFEAHGTGTAVGDPIEAGAIGEIFAPYRSPTSPLFVGALKSNIGHLEGAAGVAAVIKGVLTLEKGVIPANTWFERKNPRIEDSWNLAFPTKPVAWPQPGLRRMSINSFGVGGSNAHVVMDDAFHFLQQYSLVGSHRTVPIPRLAGTGSQRVSRRLSETSKPHSDSGMDATDSDSDSRVGEGSHSPQSANTPMTELNGPELIETVQLEVSTISQRLDQLVSKEEAIVGRLDPISRSDGGDKKPELFVFSSYDQGGIDRIRAQLSEYLECRRSKLRGQEDRSFLGDLSYTLACKRTRHAWRSFCLANSRETLSKAMLEKPVVTRALTEPRLAFVFTGQGAQWPAMGRQLMAHRVFRESLYDADVYLSQTLRCSWSLTHELCKDSKASHVNDAEFSQPLCTALQVALVDLLRTWRVLPHAVVGHSSGEIGAAYAAGHISRESAWRIAYYRGKLSKKLIREETPYLYESRSQNPKTGMAAVGLDKERTLEAIQRVDELVSEGALEIACLNSQESHTVSGDIAKLDALVELLKSENVFARKLNVEIGYHSRHMRPIAEEYRSLIGDISSDAPVQPKEPSRPQYFSSLEGDRIPASRLRDPGYWVDNLVSPVSFHEAVVQMLQSDLRDAEGTPSHVKEAITDLLEIGPHSALAGPLRNIVKQVHKGNAGKIGYTTVLKRGESAVESSLEAAGSLFCRGFDIDFAVASKHDSGLPRSGSSSQGDSKPVLMLTDLPGYPFNHAKEYWAETRLTRNYRFRAAPRHELLGAPAQDWDRNDAVWRNFIRLSENPWVEDHKVSGDILYPAAGMLVMAIEASRQLADKDRQVGGFRFKDVSFHLALCIPEDGAVETHLRLRPSREEKYKGWNEFLVCSVEKDDWREHCRGFVRTEYHADSTTTTELRQRCQREIERARGQRKTKTNVGKIYRTFRGRGMDFGPRFQTLHNVKLSEESTVLAVTNSLVSEIKKVMPHQYLQPHLVHPSMLDSVVQTSLVPLVLKGASKDALVPVFASDIWVSATTTRGESAAEHHDSSYLVSAQSHFRPGGQTADSELVAVHAETEEPMVSASGLVFKAVPSTVSHGDALEDGPALNLDWKPDPRFLSEEQASRVFGLPETQGTGSEKEPSDLADCEALSVLYVRQFLASLDKASIAGLEWHHAKYVAWMKHVDQTTPIKTSLERIAEVEARVEAAGTPEGQLILAVGRNLAAMLLTREMDPLDVIFGNKVAEKVYREGLGSRRCYAQMCAYMDSLAHVNPSMRILEVGAGTGGATGPIMDTLMANGARRFDHYDFTDISPSFFQHAKEAFQKQAENMSFRVLNIEKEPVEQGFDSQGYDVIVAANVLHATKSMVTTLGNVRKLLKPGGKLVVFELTNPAAMLGGFCFGILPGWWLSEEDDRPMGPLMVVEQWRSYLQRAGFGGLDAVFHDFVDPAHRTSSILVSTVPAAAAAAAAEGAKSGRYYLLVDKVLSERQKRAAEGFFVALAGRGPVEMIPLADAAGRDLKGSCCIVLNELDAPILRDMEEDVFAAMRHMARDCAEIVWLTQGGEGLVADPERELVTGLSRVIRAERAAAKDELSFSTVRFAQGEAVETIVGRTTRVILSSDVGDNEFRVADGVVYVPRLVEAPYLTEHINGEGTLVPGRVAAEEVDLGPLDGVKRLTARIDLCDSGSVDVHFEKDNSATKTLEDDEIEFRMMACGLAPRNLPSSHVGAKQDPEVLEAAGIITAVGSAAASSFAVGDKVLGVCLSGQIKTHCRARAAFTTKLPDSISWTQAAGLPLAYVAASALLQHMGAVGRGDRLLIHRAATSAAGLAAVIVARAGGAEVFATVGDAPEERELLVTAGALLPSDHVLETTEDGGKLSRSTEVSAFDIVLDPTGFSDAEALLDHVAPFGRFIELSHGSATAAAKSQIATGLRRRNIRFERFDAADFVLLNPAKAERVFQQAAAAFISRHPVGAFPPAAAFTLSSMSEAASKLQGQMTALDVKQPPTAVFVEAQDADVVRVVPEDGQNIQHTKSGFRPDATYIVAGGLGGAGRSIARWMASRGAKNLVLLSRSGASSDEAKELLSELEADCDKVVAPVCDVTDREALKRVLDECTAHMPPVRGVIQGAMDLKDKRFVDMSLQEWNAAARPKVQGTLNLYNVVGGQQLDFFVMLSSIVSLWGATEQASYAAGGTFQDAFARSIAASASAGGVVVSLDLPVLLDVGFVAEKPELMDELKSAGWSYMDEDDFRAVLGYHCLQRRLPQKLDQSQAVLRAQLAPRAWRPAEGTKVSAWMSEPLFSHLRQRGQQPSTTTTTTTEAKKETKHAALLLAASASAGEAERVVVDALLEKLARVLSVELSNLDAANALSRYGVDSLVAVGLRSWLAKELGAEVSVFEMTGKPSIYALAAAVVEKSRLVTFER